MNIDDIWKSYSESIAEIELTQRATERATERELQELQNINTLSSDKMMFSNLVSGERIVYFRREMSHADRCKEALLRKNRQYQWLLVETYEKFESYLLKLYAYCGLQDANFWPQSDYVSINLSERNSLDFKWHLEQAKKRKAHQKVFWCALETCFHNFAKLSQKINLR